MRYILHATEWPKANHLEGENIPFLTLPLSRTTQHCNSQQQAGLCHRETPLLSSQIYGCLIQADVSLALTRKCLRGCLNNSTLRADVSLSEATLQRELLSAANSPEPPRCTECLRLLWKTCTETKAAYHTALQKSGIVNKYACLQPTIISFCSCCLQCCCCFAVCTTNTALICSIHRNRYGCLTGCTITHSNES